MRYPDQISMVLRSILISDFYLKEVQNRLAGNGIQLLTIYKKIYDLIDEGVIVTDKKGYIISVNRAFTDTTGYQFEEVADRNPNILNSGKHGPEFYIMMWSSIHETGEWEGEIWNKRKNGEVYPEWLKVTAVRNEKGEITNYLGVFSDISIRKNDEKNLRLFKRMFENTSEGIMITDTQGNILSVNPAFTETTGYSGQEVLGKNPNILNSGRQGKEFYINMWSSIHETGRWEGEIWNRRKNGEIYPEWLSINAVRDEYGNITNYVGIFTDITERKQVEDHFKYLAHYDTLTGLPNRFLFNKELDRAIDQTEPGQILAVLFLDMDRFKLINDTLGHTAGDRVLKELAKRLKKVVREQDIIARLAGDEFTILLTDLEDYEEVVSVVKRIITAGSEPYILQGKEFFVSISIGISLYPEHGDNNEDLIKNADSAMYRAKKKGNGYQFYNFDMKKTDERIVLLKNGLYRVIEQEELSIYYQPQIDVENRKIIGLEALIRWNHPNLGIVSPDEFIPVAEETGLIVQIGEWMLKEVCLQYQRWKEKGCAPSKISVNLSVRQIQDKNLVDTIRRIVRETKIAPDCLELEITESMSMVNMESILNILESIKSLNVRLSIDDFGTGHSSLSYLARLPVDTLKIDKSFVQNLSDSENVSIVRAIIDMAHALNLQVIAEGVETEEAFQFLQKHGCDMVQGFLFATPLRLEEVEKML